MIQNIWFSLLEKTAEHYAYFNISCFIRTEQVETEEHNIPSVCLKWCVKRWITVEACVKSEGRDWFRTDWLNI